MAEDSCEITEQIAQEEEEEEVDPEMQDTGRPPFGISAGSISGIGDLQAGTVGAREAARIDAQSSALTPTEEAAEIAARTIELTSEALGYADANRISAVANIARQVNQQDIRPGLPGTDILLEDDLTITPVVTNLFSAKKSTWLFANGTIMGEGTANLVFNGPIATERFRSKPKELLATSPDLSATSTRRPCNPQKVRQVNDSDTSMDIYDSVRWVSDKVWFNVGHLNGPIEYSSVSSAKFYHQKSGADLYFINRKPGGGDLKWGVFYQGPKLFAHFSLIDESRQYAHYASSVNNWQYYNRAKEDPNLQNKLGFKVSNEVHVIECLTTPGHNWRWSNYFYGHIPNQILTDMGLDTPWLRNNGTIQGNPVNWKNIYTVPLYNRVSEGASLNAFPVIPFYGESNYSTISSTDPINVTTTTGVTHTGEVVFMDYTTNVTDLLTKDESDFVNVGSNAYFDIRPVYSYYDCLYEEIISTAVTERELPSPYQGQTLMKALSNARKQGVSSFLDEDFDELRFARLLAADRFYDLSSLSDVTPSDISNYQLQLEQYRLIQNMMNGSDASTRAFVEHMAEYYALNIDNNNKDVLLSSIPREVLDDLYEQRYLNPMFVEMELGKIERSVLASALSYDGDNSIIMDLMNTLASTEGGMQVDASYVDQALQTSLNQTAEVEPRDLISHSDTIPLDTKVLDFEDWWPDFFERVTSSGNLSPVEKFAAIFRLLKTKMKINQFVESSARSYDQILSGVPAKSEVMGFMIEKYKNNELITNFYIMSNNDREVEKFVDSQVRYGEVYEYRINRIVAVVGNKYTYHNCLSNIQRQTQLLFEEGSAINRFDMPFGVRNQPCLKICILPSTQRRVVVLDSPPTFPDVEVIPFKNVDNKIAFRLSPNGGEYLAPPVILEEDDRLKYVNVALSQGLIESEDGPIDVESLADTLLSDPANARLIKHKSDDPAKKFEVFRTTEYPRSLSDFTGRKIATIESTADNAVFENDIAPNVKYYYIFRCVDIHDKVSNPGYIHEIELVKVRDAVRLSHKVVDPEDVLAMKLAKEQATIEAQQFIMLRPNFDQKILNLNDSGKFSEWKEGMDSFAVIGNNNKEKLWKKKFKIRVRSKSTGKEIDIDVTFDLKLTEDQENKKVNLIC